MYLRRKITRKASKHFFVVLEVLLGGGGLSYYLRKLKNAGGTTKFVKGLKGKIMQNIYLPVVRNKLTFPGITIILGRVNWMIFEIIK